tara:strand:+ start:1919 stop:2146 length:228 start_codon:yes stop_codon:yes gene_type:complete
MKKSLTSIGIAIAMDLLIINKMGNQIKEKAYELDAVSLIDEFMRICRQKDNVQLKDAQFVKKMHGLYNDARKLGF